jgi:hypothetical protein
MELVVPCEVYTRVVGYFSPVSLFNKGKKAEFHDRKTFSQELAIKHIESKVEPEIVENGAKGKIYIGVEMCTACQEIKEKIKSKKIEAKYYSFKKVNDLIKWAKETGIHLVDNLSLPLELTSDEV